MVLKAQIISYTGLCILLYDFTTTPALVAHILRKSPSVIARLVLVAHFGCATTSKHIRDCEKKLKLKIKNVNNVKQRDKNKKLCKR